MKYVFLLLLIVYTCPLLAQNGEFTIIKTIDTAEVHQRIMGLKKRVDYRPDSVKRELDRIVLQCQLNNYPPGARKALIELAILAARYGQYDTGFNYANGALALSDTNLHKEDIALIYNTVGNLYRGQAEFLKAYQAFLKAERFASNSPVLLGKIWNNMSNVLNSLGYSKKSLGLLEKAARVAREYQNGYLWVVTLLNFSNRYVTPDNAEKRQHFTDSAIQIAGAFKEFTLLHEAMLHKAADLLNTDEASAALKTLSAADTIAKLITIPLNNRQMYFRVKGAIYQRLGDYKLAEKCFLEAANGLDELNKMRLYNQLSRLYEEMGDYKRAYYMFRHNKEAEARFGALVIHDRINELETQYRTAEKDRAIADQKLLVAQKVHQVKTRNLWLGIIGGGSLLLAVFSIVVFRNMRHKQRLHLAREENVRLRSLIEGEEEERKRISGELHDGIGGVLSAAKMTFSGMQYLKREDRLKYYQGIQLLDEAYKDLRRTAHNLSPELLKQQGLLAATAGFCDKLALAHQLDIRFQHFGNFSDLSESFMLSAYRIIQELVHNVVKHALASKVLVQLVKEGTLVDLTVEDDGIGMPEEKATGLGLHNLARRVKALKGVLEVDSRSGQGTTVYITGLKTDVAFL